MSVIQLADEKGLSPHMLYESVMELSEEGLMTAGCLNHAAGILLTDLGLPEYFFRNISKDALKRVLQAIGTNLQFQKGEFILRGAVSEVQFDIDGGVHVRIATPQTRDRMEMILNPVLAGHRIEYYCGHEHGYYTYIICPERCRRIDELGSGESPFAFAQPSSLSQVPEETRQRYAGFLQRALADPVPLIEVSESTSTAETRVMFREDFSRSILPVVRRLVADLGMRLNRAYWETFTNPVGRTESICSIYLAGRPPEARLREAVDQLQMLLAIQPNDLDQLYVDGQLRFCEYLFSLCAAAFVHSFIYKTHSPDGELMEALQVQSLRQIMAKRVFEANRSEYTRRVILDTMRQYPAMLQDLYRLFDRRFNPRFRTRSSKTALARKIEDFRRRVSIAFIDDPTGRDVLQFMLRLVAETLKTNFYKIRKRSFAFRFGQSVLDPLVFPGPVYGVFFVTGFYAIGTHMRAEDIARGGLRLIRVTPGNYETELDNMPLLNFALGPIAQRLKHKDIAESGAKGVIVPHVEYARDGLSALLDLTEGILDLIQPSPEVVDLLNRPEMIFFGPDEGTAGFMDEIAIRARDRGYPHWRTMTTGKRIGIPHDTYGLTTDRRVFGLIPRGHQGTEFQIEGVPQLLTTDTAAICRCLEGQIDASGMTTMSVMTCFRTMLEYLGMREEDIGLMMTGGPDGDLGANQIQSFKGRICLIVDGGAILFDPAGLDRGELLRLALARHAEPRLNSLAYPEERLSPRGFRVPRTPGQFPLPDGTMVEDGAFFHRNFLTDPATRQFVGDADIRAFVPCGGFKDTINAANVRDFIANFPQLRIIVEGANVFFDGAARETIARETSILQIKDSSANKGGVTSSSIAEVLTAFLLGDEYESVLVDDPRSRSEMIRAVFDLIAANATAETRILLALREQTGQSLERLSVRTSEDLLSFQARLYGQIDTLLADRNLIAAILQSYIPANLERKLGMERILCVLGTPELEPYRNAILTKKTAAMALYRHATEWDAFLAEFDRAPVATLKQLFAID